MLMETLGQAQKERSRASGIACSAPMPILFLLQPRRAAFLTAVPSVTTMMKRSGVIPFISNQARKVEPAEKGVQSVGTKIEGQSTRAQSVYASGILASYELSRTVAMP